VNVHNAGAGARIAKCDDVRFVVALVTSLAVTACIGPVTGPGGGGGDQPDGGTVRQPDARVVDIKAIFRLWSGCMTLTNFQTANMATAWPQVTTNDGKQCINCHSEGQYNFIATDDETAFFNGISQHSYFMAKYFAVDTATEKVIVNTLSFKGANSTVGHPKFNADMNQGMTALNTFYTATAANTACDPPRMVD
jgi:hypothetical protein